MMTGVMPAVAVRKVGRRRVAMVTAALSIIGVAACSTGDDAVEVAEPAAEAKYTVVVADAPIADLVAKVAGDAVEVRSLVPVGADGHTYTPQPSDARRVADADLFIENGLGLNIAVSNFAVSTYKPGTPHHVLSETIPRAEILATDSAEEIASHGHAHNFNAHLWPDPIYAIAYVERIRTILAEFDPGDASGYETRATALVDQLRRLDTATKEAIATIPRANRKLVVYHDSWSYFGRRYGLPVIGAIQPVDFSEPSAAEVRRIIDQVRRERVPAFFGSEVFPSDVLDTIARESGAKYVADLSDDRLPAAPGTPEHSYLGMMVANVRSIVTALGGNASALDAAR